MPSRSGACQCGKCKVTVSAEPLSVSMCHCHDCQRRTGSSYSVHGYFPRDSVTVEGSPASYARKGDSGAFVTFHFCQGCGSTIFWEAEASPERLGVPAGLFADPDFPKPTVSIFTPHKHTWLTVPDGVPQNAGHSAAFAAAAAAAVARREGRA